MIEKPKTWRVIQENGGFNLYLSCDLEDGTIFNMHMFRNKVADDQVVFFQSMADRLNGMAGDPQRNEVIDEVAEFVEDESQPPLAHRGDLANKIRELKR